jgi:hypothetical protein
LRAKADTLRERHEGRGLMLRARKNGRGEPPLECARLEKNLGFVKIAHGLCRISAGAGQ